MRFYGLSALMTTTALSMGALTLGALGMGALAAAPAQAQENASQSSVADDDLGAIIVTGTRIVRDGYTAPTPVTVATAEDLLKSTPSSVPDALNKLPQFGNSMSPGKSANNWSTVPIHGNVLNLRSLGTPGPNPKGPLRTLILFDGIRVPATTYIGTVDTNVLPQMLMQRVDVVTGGASAGYGSDAVAGVVNFVLDKQFTGIKGVAQAGIAQRGYSADHRIGLAGGMDFADGRGHVLLSGEYYKTSGMLRSDRVEGRESYAYVGKNPGAGAPGTDANPYVIRKNVLISAISPNGRIVGSNVAGNPYVGNYINSNGTTRPFDTGQAVGTAGFQIGGDGYGIPANNAAIAPYKTYQTFGRLSYELTPSVNAYVQGIWSRTEMRYPSQQNALVPPTFAMTIHKGNPYLSPELDASLPTEDDYLVIGQADPGNPQPIANERATFWMATAGLDGEIGQARWSLSYTHGETKHIMNTSGLWKSQNVFAAIDAVTDPNTGQPTCRVLLDPANAAHYAGCTPLDVLHGNSFLSTPAGYEYATGTSGYRALMKQDSVEGSISSSLFELPAGPVDLVVGGEYRKSSFDLTSNADPALLAGATAAETAAIRAAYFAGLRDVPSGALHYWLVNVGSGHGSINVKEAFAEVAVPLLRDTPFFEELSLNGAARITDYSSSGTVKTWKLGGTWKPTEDLLLRATWSRDIRAPNLFELYAGSQSGIGIVNDVQVKDGSGNVIYGSGMNVNVNSTTSGNTNLKPEIGKTLTFGGVLSPAFAPGFSIAVDYYRIKVTDIIDTLSAQQILTNCANAGGTGAVECGLIDRATPTSFPSMVYVVPANISFLETAGLDIDASYRTSLGNGALAARLYANYLGKFDAQQYLGAPISHYAGVSVVSSNPAGMPRWRGSLSLDYSNGPFGVTVSEQYIGPMRLDVPGGPRPIVFEEGRVGSVFYTDLAVRFTIPQGNGNVEIFGNVSNLFDRDPQLVPGMVPGVAIPTNIAVYDFVGRAFTAGARFRF